MPFSSTPQPMPLPGLTEAGAAVSTALPAAIAPAIQADAPASLNAGDKAGDQARVAQAAEKFESLFINEMLKQMRRTNEAFAAEDSPSRNRINEDMLAIADTAVADALASQRAFGIADAIVRQLVPTAPAAAPKPLKP